MYFPGKRQERWSIIKLCKEARLMNSGMPDDGQLEKINHYAKSPLTAQEVYCFSVRLCDDRPDRDYERFDAAALEKLAVLFLGKTGICDHEWSADRQVARIFDTEVVKEDGATCLLARAYMLRSEKNAALIAEIEGGIKKEVSVGCSMAKARCSVCGAEYGSCAHRKGVTYDGQLCLAVLTEPTDAYEFSFVAVPAQRDAGVLKAMKGGQGMTLKDLVERSGDCALKEALHSLEQEAAFGRKRRAEMEKEVVSLGLLLDFGASEEILKKAAASLNGDELLAWREEMRKKTAELFPPQSQLPTAGSKPAALESAYMI